MKRIFQMDVSLVPSNSGNMRTVDMHVSDQKKAEILNQFFAVSSPMKTSITELYSSENQGIWH